MTQEELIEKVATMAEQYAQCALKCPQCGDVRNTWTPGGCSGEDTWRASERCKTMELLDGNYAAMRYFEKHLCRADEMTVGEAFTAFAAAIRALITKPTIEGEQT